MKLKNIICGENEMFSECNVHVSYPYICLVVYDSD